MRQALQTIAGMLTMLPAQLQTHRGNLSCRYVYAVATLQSFRRRGISTGLLDAAHAWMRQHGIAASVLAPADRDLINFYQKRGYQVVGAEPGNWSYIDHLGKKREVHEPAWRMRKRIC